MLLPLEVRYGGAQLQLSHLVCRCGQTSKTYLHDFQVTQGLVLARLQTETFLY